MIRQTDKYLLLFLLILGYLAGNAERSTTDLYKPAINYQLSTANCQPPTANHRISTDSVPGLPVHLFVVGSINISGNRVTRGYIIGRELPFKTGDTVSLEQISKYFTDARDHLIATHLFNDVNISLKEFRGYTMDINIEVKERWYIFPLPYVRPIDRNLTAWAETGFSLSRLDYGLKYSQYNFTGRNDNLRIWLITGYSREIELAYDRPNTGKNLVHGFGGGFLFSGLQELNVITTNNQQVFINKDSLPNTGHYLQTRATYSLRYYYRPAIKTKHFFALTFNQTKIDSSVLFYNPHYFLNNKLSIFYPELSYVVNYNNIDYVPYPTKGFLFEGGLTQRGFTADMNMTQIIAKTYEAFSLAPKLYFLSQDYGVLRVPFKQPFYNQQLLGYRDYFMRGLEKYVVDGVGLLLARNTLMRELISFNVPFLKQTSHDHIPFRVYAKTYFDVGYTYNKYYTMNSLQNTVLYSGGVGVDIVTFYDFVFRTEFSINQFGEKGLFFHIRNDF